MEDPEFTVEVAEVVSGGAEALRAVGEVSGLSLWHSRQLLDGAPATVLGRSSFDAADRAGRRLREAGVPAVLRCTWCDRSVPADGTLLDPGPCVSRYWPTAHCRANSLTVCDCSFCRDHGSVV